MIARQSITGDQAGALLSKADSAFTGNAKKINAAVDKNSKCFFALTEPKVGRADDELLCGPVRIYGSSEKQVWVPLSVSGGGKGSPILADGGPKFEPVELPTGARIVRPDGASPVTDAKLTAPKPPAAAAGLVQTSIDVGPAKMAKPAGGGLLASPSRVIQISETAVTPVIGTGADARSAAPGEEFVVTRFMDTSTTAGGVAYPGVLVVGADPGTMLNASTTDTLLVGGIRKELPKNDEYATTGKLPSGEIALVLSVPKGQRVALEVFDNGKAQTLDLRTGKHAGDGVFAPLYRSKNYADLNQPLTGQFSYPDVVNRVQQEKITGTVRRAALLPSLPGGKGYAPAGKAWLGVHLDDFEQGVGVYEWSPASFTITPTGGAAINGAINYDVTVSDFVYFAVPPNFTTGTLTFNWTGKFGGQPITSAGPQSIPVSIPAK